MLTPYQRYDWISAILPSRLELAQRVAIAIVRSARRPVGVLPLAIDRHFGFDRGASYRHVDANGDWLASNPDPRKPDPPDR